MKFLKQYLIQVSVLTLSIFTVFTAYAALTTVNSGDPLTASSWNEVIGKLTNLDTNPTDLVTKSYVDNAISAAGGSYPLTNTLSNENPSCLDLGQAVTYCRDLTEGGFSDWNLPTVEQLGLYINNPNDNSFLWTLSDLGSAAHAQRRLSDGYIRTQSPSSCTPVRCVR